MADLKYALQAADPSDLVTFLPPDPDYISHPMACTELEKSYIINTINGEQGGSQLGSILIAQVIRDIFDYAGPQGLGWTITSVESEIGSNIFSKSYLKSGYANCSQFAKDAYDYVFAKGGCAYPHKLMNEWAAYLGTGGYALTPVLKLHTYYDGYNKKDAGWVLCNDYSFANTYVNPLAKDAIAKGWNVVSGSPTVGAIQLSASAAQNLGWNNAVMSRSPEDAVVREFVFLDDDYKAVFEEKKLKLSVINYVPLVAGMASAMGISNMSYSGGIISGGMDTSDLTGNCKLLIDYLMSKGLNGAAACGVAGNVEAESSFRPECVGDHGTSFGICQWHAGRGTAMKNFVGSNWATNLSGQFDYLWYDLEHNYSSTLSHLRSVPNSVDGAKSAADYFVRHFEIPSNIDAASIKRQTNAEKYFNMLKPLAAAPGATAVGLTSLAGHSGSALSIKQTIAIPSSVAQTGLSPNYTNYTYWFSKWGWNQRKIADIWNQKGRTNSKGIATIDGHYLLAMTLKFGTTGDLVVVHLANGESFSAIIADSKGGGDGVATTQWGHYLGGGGAVDIIEWEAFGTAASSTSGVNITLGSWSGVKVTSVDNYGSWLTG